MTQIQVGRRHVNATGIATLNTNQHATVNRSVLSHACIKLLSAPSGLGGNK